MKPNQKGKEYTDFKKEMKRRNELLNKPVYNHPNDYPKDLMKSFLKAKQEQKKDTIYGSLLKPSIEEEFGMFIDYLQFKIIQEHKRIIKNEKETNLERQKKTKSKKAKGTPV